MRWWLAAGVSAAASLLIAMSRERATAKSAPLTIGGGDLPHSIVVPFADLAALGQGGRMRVIEPPTGDLGPAYDAGGSAWLAPLPENEETGDERATYYPMRGVARITTRGGDVWLEPSEWWNALLRRYVALGRAGLLTPEPGIVEVLAGASRAGELLEVRVAGRPVPSGTPQEEALWRSFSAAAGAMAVKAYPEIDLPTALRAGSIEISIRLTEGRTVTLHYVGALRAIVDLSAALLANILYNPVSVFDAPPSLGRLLNELAAPAEVRAMSAREEPARASGPAASLWIGALVALVAGVALAGKVALRRRERDDARDLTGG